MKNFILLYIITFSFNMFGQEFKLSDLPYVTVNDSVANIYDKLPGLQDKQALIIKVSYTCYWYGGTICNIVAYQNDGTVIKYDAFYPNSGKVKIKKKKVSKKKAGNYQNALTNWLSTNFYNIEPSKLDISRWTDEKGYEHMQSVSDGVLYNFKVIQGNNVLDFTSNEPEVFIKAKVPGYEEREKYLVLLSEFRVLWDKY